MGKVVMMYMDGKCKRDREIKTKLRLRDKLQSIPFVLLQQKITEIWE